MDSGESFHWPWPDPSSESTTRTGATGTSTTTTWIHNNNFALNGTVTRPTWQSHSPIYSNRIYWRMSRYPAMVSDIPYIAFIYSKSVRIKLGEMYINCICIIFILMEFSGFSF